MADAAVYFSISSRDIIALMKRVAGLLRSRADVRDCCANAAAARKDVLAESNLMPNIVVSWLAAL